MAGSLISRGNNKWELRVSAGYDENNKQRRFTKTVYARSKKEAQTQLATYYLEVTGRLATDKAITFSEFVTYWEHRYSKKVGKITMVNYQQMLKDRLLPAFGFMRIDKIKGEDVLRFMDQLCEDDARLDTRHQKGLSSVTIMKHFKLLKLLFNKACEWKYLSKNPCADVPKDMLVKATSEHYPIWNREELHKFLGILEELPVTLPNVKNKLMFYIALTTGARKGEFLGLTWDCVDLESCSLNINKAMKFVSGEKPALGTPKTKASIRTLYFDDYVKKLIQTYKELLDLWLQEEKISNPQNLVFVSRNCTENRDAVPVNGDSFYLWLKRMCKKHQMPRIAVHSLRAMAATYALISGMPLNMVQAMMGHTDISTTSIYLRDVQDERKSAVALLSNQFEALRTGKE